PNQVNNMLGFPFIFRRALDCRATSINEEMKLAAARALADLAREDVPDSVLKAYGEKSIRFGPEYLIPKPFDPRIMLWVTPAVARAAVESGAAQLRMEDYEEYKLGLEARLGKSRQVMRLIINKARRNPKRIVFPEAEHPRVLRAAQIVLDEGFGHPILIGSRHSLEKAISDHRLNMNIESMTLIERESSDLLEPCVELLYKKRRRRGITRERARQKMLSNPNYFAAAMVQMGEADTLISGLTSDYSYVLRPAIELVDKNPDVAHISSMHMIVKDQWVYFFADTVVNINPDADTLADITLQAAHFVRNLDIEPRVALLSYSNFGSTNNGHTRMLASAVKKIKEKEPGLNIDGEMMVDYALNPQMRGELYSFSSLKGAANIFIFPELNSANIAFRMINRLGGADKVGPILMGFEKSIHVLARECDVQEIVNMAAIAVVDAQEKLQARSKP
ncbi:MAG: phosphate acyltransferase, partial [Candidatus Latescibacterota bacterium]